MDCNVLIRGFDFVIFEIIYENIVPFSFSCRSTELAKSDIIVTDLRKVGKNHAAFKYLILSFHIHLQREPNNNI